MKLYLILVIIFLFNTDLVATEFINLKVGARGVAMGGAFTAVSDDANLLQYNPAGLAFLTKKELMISYLRWLADIDTEYLSYVHPGIYKGLNFGVGLQWFDLTMTKTDLKGVELGDLKIREYLTVFSFSSKLSPNLSFGTNIKVADSTLSRYSSTALLADAGILFLGPLFDIGIAINSFQLTPFKYKLVEERISTHLRAGIAKFMRKMCFSADIAKETDEEKIYLHTGLEYIVMPELALQFGYKIGYDIETFSFGIRINLLRGKDKYILNLAHLHTTDISPVYSATFNIKFM